MKKILLASTALVVTAGFASAEIKFTGDASMGLKHDGTGLAVHYETTLMATLSGETDSGLSFGADLTLPYEKGSKVKYDTYGTAEEFTSATVGSSAVLYVEGDFGKLAFGEIENGNALGAVITMSDVGWDGLGLDDLLESVAAGSVADIAYIGTFADFTVAASYGIGDKDSYNDWALSAEYLIGNYSVGLGYGQVSIMQSHEDESAAFKNPEMAIALKLGADYGNFKVAASYSTTTVGRGNYIDLIPVNQAKKDYNVSAGFSTNLSKITLNTYIEAYGMNAGYTVGDITVSGAYSKYVFGPHEAIGYGVGIAYDLGSGASFKVGVGDVNKASVADLGISMTF